MELNRLAPDFELRGLDGRLYRLGDCRGQILVVDFWSCDCPHVERTDASLRAASARWGADVVLWMVASNANESDAALENASRSRGPFTVLKDAGHRAADLFGAQVTPEVFVMDRGGVVRYRGAVDDVSLCRRAATRFFAAEAVEALLAGRLPPVAEVPAFGCAIVRDP